MPILFSALLSLVVAWLRGTSPLALGGIRLRRPVLPLVALGLQWLGFVVFASRGGSPPAGSAWYALPVQLASLGLLLAFVAANRHYRSLLLVGLGVALNLVVVAANGGYMPVRAADVARIGLPEVAAQLETGGYFQKSRALDEHTRLALLADVIHVPFFGAGRMVSAGDVLVAAGVFLFIQEALVATRAPVYT
jgi:hypothetical protein